MALKQIEKAITSREEDYSQWYLDVILAAELAEYSSVKGSMIIRPNGYAIWEKIQQILDKKFKETGVRNAYFPLFIPERLLKKEAEHVEGFAPQVAVVTHAGGKKLEEPLVIRPTSETIMYEAFSKWIRSYRDLPLLINQWANVVRWEMRPRLFLRTIEFLWQEGHTVHATEEEAEARARMMLEIYKNFAQDYMALPTIAGVKTESEKFAGAQRTYTLEAMMQDGRALQFATSHNLGQNFSKPFGITFLDAKNKEQYAWQTSWGLSTRVIGGLVMAHSDDRGLVLPPRLASLHAVIVPVFVKEEEKEEVHKEALSLYEKLSQETDLGLKLDDRDIRSGEKFYQWEKKGVPVRIEIGPKEIKERKAILVRRDSGEKKEAPVQKLTDELQKTLDTIQADLFNKALAFRESRTKKVDSWDDFVKAVEDNNFVFAHWSGEESVEREIQEKTGATIRCIPFDSPKEKGKCVLTGRPSERRVLFAKAY